MLKLSCLLVTMSCTNATGIDYYTRNDSLPVLKNSMTYVEAKKSVDSMRHELADRYNCGNDSVKKEVLKTSGKYLSYVIGNTLGEFWIGTPWDFNGTTTTPQAGTIACGYFVTTLLRDAGYRLDRVQLAICPSKTMMQKLTSPQMVRNLSRMTLSDFEKWIKAKGEGVYIVGLDYHTGFILTDGETVWFFHSNYLNRSGVSKEILSKSLAFNSSKTKYITRLSGDTGFLLRWLFN